MPKFGTRYERQILHHNNTTANMAFYLMTSRNFLRSSKLACLVWLLFISHFPLIESHDLILQKCLPKADMENVTITCGLNERIAIKEAFFTSSIVDQCPFAIINQSTNEIIRGAGKTSCTDDIRITLNERCSGRPHCSVNLRKAHVQQCSGYDGWINIKYACVTPSKMHSYCNLELRDNYGYVSNPGYPKYYPSYHCKWKIKAYEGQRIQIDFLDISLKEPRYTNNKMFAYECTDYASIIENDAAIVTVCGESKANLIEYRSKTNELMVNFVSYDFSPTRGVFFKYTLLNCPTLKAPYNGNMFRNGSYAYYSCHFDYVFEDSGLPDRILHCDYDTYWNGSVARCVPKENATVKAFALTHPTVVDVPQLDTAAASVHKPEAANGTFLSRGLITPIIMVSIVLLVLLVLIAILIHLKRTSNVKIAV